MYYILTSCLVLFFVFFLVHPFPCTSSKHKFGGCETLFQCGNITAGFPFWGEKRDKLCGHPLLELHCNKNITSIFISNQDFKVLQINKPYNNTLTLARTDHMGSFCSSTFTNTILSPEIFKLSPTYKNLTVFYHCFPFPPNFSNYLCPRLVGYISVSENDRTCLGNFNVNVPTGFVAKEKKLNMTNLESVLRKGFEVKVKIDKNACRECSSFHELCGFNESLPLGVKCGPLHLPTDMEYERMTTNSVSLTNVTNPLPSRTSE